MADPARTPLQTERSSQPGGPAQFAAAALPVVALVSAVLVPALILAVAGDTLGYDFHAYYAAATRVLNGQPAYDLTTTVAGPYGLFLYPPTFLPLAIPFALLPVGVATWAWTALLAGATLAAIALMPVSARTRWLVLLLFSQAWPVLYALKLGQVGAILVLLFVVGWRAVDPAGEGRGGRTAPLAFGVAAGLGAAIKIQPGLLLAWALATRRWTAVIAGVCTLAVLAAAGTALAGVDAWGAFLTVLGRVNDAVSTPHNFTPGAVAFGLGVPHDAAVVLQWASMLAVVAVAAWAAIRLPAVPSFLIAVVATQLLSPILWDHYAVVLMVPVAWLLERRQWWAVGVPVAMSVLLIGVALPVVYVVAYIATLAGLVVAGRSIAPVAAARGAARIA